LYIKEEGKKNNRNCSAKYHISPVIRTHLFLLGTVEDIPRIKGSLGTIGYRLRIPKTAASGNTAAPILRCYACKMYMKQSFL
jgi:hypothetical protein